MAIRPLDPGISSGGGSSGGGGSLNMKSKSVAVNTSVTAADSGKIITTTASGITLTLDAVAGLGDGFTLVVKNTSNGNITVATSGSDKIDGASTFVIPASEVALIQGDSTALQVVVLSTLKMARLPIFQDNGTWNAVSTMEEQVVDIHTVIDTTTAKSNIAYGSGLYVVMGNGAAVFTSPDLVTWTSRSLTVSGGSNKYIGSNGTSFMALEHATTNVHKSSDGVTWTKTTALPGSGFYQAPVYAGGLWLIYVSTTQYYTSTDGAVWTTRSYPATINGYLYQVGNSVWVAGGTTSDAVAYYTTDGINWTAANLPYIKSTFVGTPYFTQDGYLCWMYNNKQLYRTADGITWTAIGPTPPAGFSGASYALVNLNGAWAYYNGTTGVTRLCVYTNGAWVTRGSTGYFNFNPNSGGYSKWGGNSGHFINGKILYTNTTGVYELKTGTSGSYGLFVK